MYGYQSDTPTNIYAILDCYNQEEIFKIALGDYPMLGTYITSPLRSGDNRAGCWFEWKKNRLYFVDFADNMINRDAIQFIKDYFNLSTIAESIDYIISYFDENKLIPHVSRNMEEKLPEKHKQYSTILFQSKLFDQKDRLFWNPFEITREQLREDSVFSLLQYKVYSPKTEEWYTRRPYWLSYAIGGFGNRFKIYNPERANRSKWITNCTCDDVGGINTLPAIGDILIITKSYKDWRVIKNQGYHVVWFQNEGMIPSDHILLDLISRFTHIYILFDNDDQGIKATIKVKEKFESLGKVIFFFTSPYSYLKDPADILSTKGRVELTKFLWENCQQQLT